LEEQGTVPRVAAQLMRRILVDHSRGHDAKKRGGGVEKVSWKRPPEFPKARRRTSLHWIEALTRLAEFDPQQAQLVELRFFGGLSIEESAGVLRVSRTTLKRNWNLAKAWLARELRKATRNMPENWDQVKELFTLALERDPEERNDFLRQACGATILCAPK